MQDPKLRQGLGFALLAYGAWGVIPLYWRMVGSIPPPELLAYRVVFSLACIALFLAIQRSLPEVSAALKNRRTLLLLTVSSLLIGGNWGIFIASIEMNRLSEASLGYFLTPLLNVALAVLVLKERLRPLQTTAVALAAAGVLVLVVLGGGLPWVALCLATSFAIYGLVRRTVVVGATAGLMIETLVLTPIAAAYLWYLGRGSTAWTAGPATLALASLSGPLTALPLIWFSRAARALPFSVLGLTQYLSPTGQFLIAVLLFHEEMPAEKWVAFALIWLALGLFTVDLVAANARAERSR
ncbi:MAG: EamA family transporter RarD [Myxococcota bacterium]